MRVVDLSLPIDEATPVFRVPPVYADPPTELALWTAIGQVWQGWRSPFKVSRLSMGLHTGTHVDAPSHFSPGGDGIQSLPAHALVGRAALIDLSEGTEDQASRISAIKGSGDSADRLPLIVLPERGLDPAAIDELIAWRRRLVVFAGSLDGEDPTYPATAALLHAGIYVVGDVDVHRCRLVEDGDLLVVAPLPLANAEASPCRVLAIGGLDRP